MTRIGSNKTALGATDAPYPQVVQCSDRGDAQGSDDVSPLGGTTGHRDDREMWGRRRVGVSSSRGGDGIRGDLHIGVYIKRRKTTMKERVACWPIYELCMEAERRPRTIRMVRWWYQDAVNDPEE